MSFKINGRWFHIHPGPPRPHGPPKDAASGPPHDGAAAGGGVQEEAAATTSVCKTETSNRLHVDHSFSGF